MEKYINDIKKHMSEISNQIDAIKQEIITSENIRNLLIRDDFKKISRASIITLSFVGAIHSTVLATHQHFVNEAAREALSDANLHFTDDSDLIGSSMTDEELAAYVDKHNITLEELSKAVRVKLKWDLSYSEENMKEVESLNSEAFEEAAKNSKGM